MFAVFKMELSGKTVYGPVLKTTQLSGYSSDITIPFLDPDFLIGHAISAIRGRFLMIFALDTLNVRHISTSALVDLLT